MTDNLKKIFEELAKRVGSSLEEINFDDKNWFEKHTWTVEEELNYKNWLIEFMENNPDVIEDLVKEGLLRRDINNMATDFVIFYGWNYKKNNQ
jgi:hypothetical protein